MQATKRAALLCLHERDDVCAVCFSEVGFCVGSGRYSSDLHIGAIGSVLR